MDGPLDRVDALATQLKELSRVIKDNRRQLAEAMDAADKLRRELKRHRQNGKAKSKKAGGRRPETASAGAAT